MKNYLIVRVSILPGREAPEGSKGQVIVNPDMGKEYSTVIEPSTVSTIEFGTKLLKKVREAAGMVQLAVAKESK